MPLSLDPTEALLILAKLPDHVRPYVEKMLRTGPLTTKNVRGRYLAAHASHLLRDDSEDHGDLVRIANVTLQETLRWRHVGVFWTEDEFLAELAKPCRNGKPLTFWHFCELPAFRQLPMDEAKALARELLEYARRTNLGARALGQRARDVVKMRLDDNPRVLPGPTAPVVDHDLAAKVEEQGRQIEKLWKAIEEFAKSNHNGSFRRTPTERDDVSMPEGPGDHRDAKRPSGAAGTAEDEHDGNLVGSGKETAA